MMDPIDRQLQEAAANGNWHEISRLLEQGIDVCKGIDYRVAFTFDEANVTLLSESAIHGHTECVQKLLEMGADRDVEYYDRVKYQYALEVTAVNEQLECFRFLVENRLFKSVNNRHKYDVIIDKCRKRNFDDVVKLLNGDVDKDVILNGWLGNNIISLFLLYGCHPSCLQSLIDCGVDVNGVDYNGFTPLMCAVLARNVRCISLLLQSGVNIGTPTLIHSSYFLEDGFVGPREDHRRDGQTALMYASCFENTEYLRQILPFCSENDINLASSDRRWTALMFAAHFGNTNAASLLLEYGASLDNTDMVTYFNAPLNAIMNRHADCLQAMLDVASQDCIHWTFDNDPNFDQKSDDCLRVLLKYTDKLKRANVLEGLLVEAVEDGNSDCVQLLLENGANVNHQAILMFCSDGKHESVFDRLLKWGVDVDKQDNEGCTAIMCAAKNNAVTCAMKLMSHGANIHVRNKKGETPLMIASANGYSEFADMLIQSGAGIEVQNDDSNVDAH